MGREKTFNIRFSDKEWARIEALAAFKEATVSDVIRDSVTLAAVDALAPLWTAGDYQAADMTPKHLAIFEALSPADQEHARRRGKWIGSASEAVGTAKASKKPAKKSPKK